MKKYWAKNLSSVEAGKYLGKGVFKRCWAVSGEPGKVLLVSQNEDDWTMERELDSLKKLKKLGFPTVEYIETGRYMEIFSAGVMRRYYCSNRDRNKIKRLPIKCINKIMKNLDKLYTQIKKKRIEMVDLQVLYDLDGSVAINDPMSIVCNSTPHYALKELVCIVQDLKREKNRRKNLTKRKQKA